MTGNLLRLVTLGRLALLDSEGNPTPRLSQHPRKLALLAVLALARRPPTRDTLVAMFWGEQDERRARHSLSDALSEIRRTLGADAVTTRSDTVALAASAPLVVDALAFRSACAVKDWARGVALYEAPFLDGVFVRNAAMFENWVSGERRQLEQLFFAACAAQIAALATAGAHDAVAALATRWLAEDPLAYQPAVALLAALRAPGTEAADRAALAAYDQFAARLLREFETAPDPRVVAIAAEIRTRLARPGDAAAVFPLSAEGRETPGAAAGRRRWWQAAAAATVLLGAATALGLLRHHSSTAPRRPVVAVLGIRDLAGDSADAWIGDGLSQMIAADLARAPAIEIVAPERVREAERAVAAAGSDERTPAALRRIATDLGATWVVTGGLTHGDTAEVLDVELYDAPERRSLTLYTVTGSALPVLADRAAARVLAAANADEPGPHFADIETASLAAYEYFIRAEEAGEAGRLGDKRRELDRAIALDSGFVTALAERMRMAQLAGSADELLRLTTAFSRASGRATPWDRLELDTYAALHDGERSRSESLARTLVSRYPHDPRAYDILAGVLQAHGEWPAADSVLTAALALDSLAVLPTPGPCAPCTAYRGLVHDAGKEGRPGIAEADARRWAAMQPDYPAAWATLASTLGSEGRFDAALDAAHHAEVLAPGDVVYQDYAARTLLLARRYADADTAIATMAASTNSAARNDAYDLRALLERERGEYRASIRTIEAAVREFPADSAMRLEEANSLAHIGDYAAAFRLDEPLAHERHDVAPPANVVTPVSGLSGGLARQFCWIHALEADAVAGAGDTTLLRALADSIAMEATRSYYGRDGRLVHHVRGLIAELAGNAAAADSEFALARWGSGGWTATLVHLARARLALQRPLDAIAALRDAYTAPLDAMGRYVPRSELDYWMWQSFRAAGETDSAARYRGFVARAWSGADPEVARLLHDGAAPARVATTAAALPRAPRRR